MSQKQQVFSRQACWIHAAVVRHRQCAAVSCHHLLAKLQTHKLVDFQGLNDTSHLFRSGSEKVLTSTYWYCQKVQVMHGLISTASIWV